MDNLHKQEVRLKKAHIALMKHPETALYSGVMLMGKSEIVNEKFTAYTDGVNKRYSKPYLETISEEPKLRGLVLHENLHVALKQIPHGREMFKEDKQIANVAADLVVNDIIYNIKGNINQTNVRIVELPDGALYDGFFHNWSMREVYNYIRRENPKRQSSSPSGGGKLTKIIANGKEYDLDDSEFDEHDWESYIEGLSDEERKNLSNKIDRCLREGGMLAGRMGGKIPRQIGDLLEPKVDWRDVLREFVSSTTRGNDEYTWRKMNKRYLANDYYLPSMENNSIGEVVVAIDTSGSIGEQQLNEFATELASIVDVVSPEAVRIIWWDYDVHGEQYFKPEHYSNIASLLKPVGGGGTRVSSVSHYISQHKINAECVIVFTDGYVESDIEWNISSPTLWMITENKNLDVPSGKKVMVNDE